MIRRPPRSTRTDTLCPYTTLFRSYLEAEVGGLTVASIYLPNGNPVPGPKFDYKLQWFERLIAHAGELLAQEVPLVLAGDYNVCPEDRDAFSMKAMDTDALVQDRKSTRLNSIHSCAYSMPSYALKKKKT